MLRRRQLIPLDPVKPDEERPPSRLRRWLPRIGAGLILCFVLLIGWLAWTAPLGKALEPLEAPALLLTAADGTPIARRGGFKGEPVDVAELPPHVPNAFIAIEDRRFYDHLGVDPIGIGRAMLANVEAGGVVQGGSTITQQLAKTSFLSLDRSLVRKMQEMLIALWLEAWLSKEEILSRYLSSVYFGDGAYGLTAAAEQYFSKEPEELTVGEAAMLAGLMKAPSRLSPTSNYDGARARGKLVIAAMREQGMLTPEQLETLRPAKLDPGRHGLPAGTYFADWIFPAALRSVGDSFGEVEVETTLDPEMQRAAERILGRALDRSSAEQGALVAMRPDGRVLAMVGGRDYSESAFNRAVQAKRQSGSAFKLFVYLAALRDGMDPDSMVEDEPVTIGDWSPENHNGRYRGEMTLEQAFAISSNVAAARIADEVGAGAIREAARDLGVESELVDDLTIALGTSQTSLLEMTAAYAAVAAGVYPIEPYGIETSKESWRDRLGGMFREVSGFPQRRELMELLNAVVTRGTGTRARLPIPAYGKTGTTQDFRDALFIGFAGDLVVGVWVGNDDNSPMNGVTGSNVPAEVWRDFMIAVSPEVRAARAQEAERQAEIAAREEPSLEDIYNGVASGDLEGLLEGESAEVIAAIARMAEVARRSAQTPEELAERAEDWREAAADIAAARRDAEAEQEADAEEAAEAAAEEAAREAALEQNEQALDEIERALEELEGSPEGG